MDKLGKYRILISLALIDDYLDYSEEAFLFKIASLENVSGDDIKKLIEEERSGEAKADLEFNLTFDEKIEILTDLIRVMKVDGKVFDAEVKFCERIAGTLGFDQKAIGFLSGNINIDPNNSTALAKIQYRMKKYLKF